MDSSECYTFTINDSWGDGILSPFSVTVNGDVVLSNPDINFITLNVQFGQCAPPSPAPSSASCENNGVCEVDQGEGCSNCGVDCFFPTNCFAIASGWNGQDFYGKNAYGIVFDVSVSTNLYFYEMEVILISPVNAKVYMKSGSYTSDPNLDNWDLVFDSLIAPDSNNMDPRASLNINSRFYASAGSTTAFYILYAAPAAFVFGEGIDASNNDATMRPGRILNQQNGNTLPSVVHDNYGFVDSIKYDYDKSTPAPVASTPFPSFNPISSPLVEPLTTVMIQSTKNNYCLDVYAYAANGSNIFLLNCDGGMNQLWIISQSSHIRSAFNNSRCIEVQEAEYSNGTPIEIQGCATNNTAQLWEMTTNGTIVSLGNSAYCIDENGYNNEVVIRNCTGAAGQQWRLLGTTESPSISPSGSPSQEGTPNPTQEDTPSPTHLESQNPSAEPDAIMVQSGRSAFCLNLPDPNSSNGNNIILLDCDKGIDQLWIISQSGHIRSLLNDDKCIGVKGTKYRDGTSIAIQDCVQDSPTQIWKLRKNGTIKSFENSKYCIGDNGYNKDAVIRNCTEATNWIQLPVEEGGIEYENDDNNDEGNGTGESYAAMMKLSMMFYPLSAIVHSLMVIF